MTNKIPVFTGEQKEKISYEDGILRHILYNNLNNIFEEAVYFFGNYHEMEKKFILQKQDFDQIKDNINHLDFSLNAPLVYLFVHGIDGLLIMVQQAEEWAKDDDRWINSHLPEHLPYYKMYENIERKLSNCESYKFRLAISELVDFDKPDIEED